MTEREWERTEERAIGVAMLAALVILLGVVLAFAGTAFDVEWLCLVGVIATMGALVIALCIGIVAVAVGLVVLRHHRWWFRLAAGIAAWGAFGAATNIWAFTH